MAHHNIVEDQDPHFIIDPITREISTESKKVSLIQGDHNSERFTFEIPQQVEGHTMPLCDAIEIHYINVDQKTKEQSAGVYKCDDVTEQDNGNIAFSWLISHQATKYMGSLNFIIKFICYNEDGSDKYKWHTAIYKGISVSSGIDNGEAVVEDCADILNEWRRSLEANQIVSLEQTQVGDGDGGENIWTATFGDGRTSILRVLNGSRGEKGLVGSIETITGDPLHFFIGTSELYEGLPEETKQGNLFAIITDDTTEEMLETTLEWLSEKAVKAYYLGGGEPHQLATDLNTFNKVEDCGVHSIGREAFRSTGSSNFPAELNALKGLISGGTLIVEADNDGSAAYGSIYHTLKANILDGDPGKILEFKRAYSIYDGRWTQWRRVTSAEETAKKIEALKEEWVPHLWSAPASSYDGSKWHLDFKVGTIMAVKTPAYNFGVGSTFTGRLFGTDTDGGTIEYVDEGETTSHYGSIIDGTWVTLGATEQSDSGWRYLVQRIA